MSSQTYRKIVFRKGNFNESKIDLTFVREVCLSLHLVKSFEEEQIFQEDTAIIREKNYPMV